MMRWLRWGLFTLAAIYLAAGESAESATTILQSGTTAARIQTANRADVSALIHDAQEWLLGEAQVDGRLIPGRQFPVGITALAIGALLDQPLAVPATHPVMINAIAYVAKFRQPDGGVYDPNEGIGVYGTSLALGLASRLPVNQRAGLDIPAMQRYLWGAQNTATGSPGSGGFDYSDKGKGYENLQTSVYALKALRDSGVPATDPRLLAALAFLQRHQDLSAVNAEPWVGKADALSTASGVGSATGVVPGSGGGVYSAAEARAALNNPFPGDTSVPRFVPSGGMTYQLLTGYLSLDLPAHDPRCIGAVNWLTRNYGFQRNPGMGAGRESQGLYHLFAVAGVALAQSQITTLTLPDGRVVDWRADLVAAIRSRRPAATATAATATDGKNPAAWWVNEQQKWAEGLPHLCTTYVLRALKASARSLSE